MERDDIKEKVRKGYGEIAALGEGCCGPSSCCGSGESVSLKIGYTPQDLAAAPPGSDLGLGCGNPLALASLEEGETVLDLGSGAGFDCFLAARRVGPSGRVIGVDMTPEMVERARENAAVAGVANVEFRLGEIEDLPVDDGSVDVVISNCVINLSPDKARVFREAFRVLGPGGRLAVSDIVLLRDLPEALRSSTKAYVGCLAGAELKDRYLEMIKEAGFGEVRVLGETPYPLEELNSSPAVREAAEGLGLSRQELENLSSSVVSIKVLAVR